MDKLKFSVSMCVYGKDDPVWFQTAVDSILHQTRQPDEVVLVVDGPVPDALDAVICTYAELPFFRVVRLAENQGHGNARRIGLEHCTYDLVALMDADDISVQDRFEKQLAVFAAKPEVSAVGGNITEFVDIPENIVGARIVPGEDAEIKEYMKKRCPLNQVTVMFRKDHVQKVGGYIDWYCEEDYYLWLRMFLADMRFANVEDTLVQVRVGKEMYQRRGGWKYFKSEAKLQGFMRRNKVISFPLYCVNCAKRLIVQVLLPNRVRGWVFQKFAQKTVK